MSNQEVDSRLTKIENELQHLTSTVQSVLSVAQGNTSAIEAAERRLDVQLNTLAQAHQQTSAKLNDLYQAFTRFVEEDRRAKERLLAHTGLINVRAEIRARFGQYEDVRRNVQGMLLALDGGLALDATMQLIAETQSINAPSYWLASAQNALAAWIRDDRGAAERALLHASSCSRGKTALFFGLLNARYGRFDATDKWFREYLNDQDAEKLSREFTVVLDAAMLGLLGDTTYERVSRQCQAWFQELCTRKNVEGQVARWQSEIARRRESASGPAKTALDHRCQVLASISPDWPRITGWYRDATSFRPMKDELASRLNLPQADESAWRARIDAILQDLRRIHEPEESGLRRQEADLLRILDYEGDTAAAEMAREAESPVDEPQVDLLTFLTNVVLHPRRFEVSLETTQLALHLTAQWVSEAAGNIVNEARTRLAEPVTIKIDGWRGTLGTEPFDVLIESFSAWVDGQTKKDVAREPSPGADSLLPFCRSGLLGLMVPQLTKSGAVHLWPIVTSASLAAAFFIAAVVAHRRIPRRANEAVQRGEQRKEGGLAALRAAETDHKQLHAAWNERIWEADRLKEFADSIALPELRQKPPGQRSRTDGLPADRGHGGNPAFPTLTSGQPPTATVRVARMVLRTCRNRRALAGDFLAQPWV